MERKESNYRNQWRAIQRAINTYERFIEQMRKAGKYYNGPAIQLGKVLSDGKIKTGDLTIQKEDYLLDCNLRLDAGKKIYLHTDNSNENLQEYKKNLLYKGDKVLIIKIEEKFVIIAKVVKPE